MDHVDFFNLFGVDVRQTTCIKGEGGPRGEKVDGATVGDLYMDTKTGEIYKCTKSGVTSQGVTFTEWTVLAENIDPYYIQVDKYYDETGNEYYEIGSVFVWDEMVEHAKKHPQGVVCRVFEVNEVNGHLDHFEEYRLQKLVDGYDLAIFVNVDTERIATLHLSSDGSVYIDVAFVKKTEWYYASLYDAIVDGDTVETGPVRRFIADNGVHTIMLRDYVSVDKPIDIDYDLSLVLNGNTIRLTNADAQFNINANFTINGENGCIEKIDMTGNAARIFNVNSGSLKITGGIYDLSGEFTGSTIGINAGSDCKEISLDYCAFYVCNENEDDSSITVSNAVTKVIQSLGKKVSVTNCALQAQAVHRCVVALHSAGDVEVHNSELIVNKFGTIKHNQNVTCIVTESVNNSAPRAVIENSKLNCVAQSDVACGLAAYGGTAIIRDSTVFTDAPGATADLNANSVGIAAVTSLSCINTKVVGTHSGISSYNNDLYVDGCTLNGFCHGGLYLMPHADNKVYVKDSTLIVGVYEGQFPDDVTTNYACFYFGADDFSTNGTVYMDGCTLEGNGYLPFVVRQGPDANHRNVLHISNMTNNATTSSKIRLNGYAYGEEGFCRYIGAQLKIGANCPFSPNDTTRRDCAAVTGALYRKTPTDMPITGDDFNALQSSIPAIVVAKFHTENGQMLTCLSHTSDELAAFLISHVPVIAHVYDHSSGYHMSCMCWVDDRGGPDRYILFVGIPLWDGGWSHDFTNEYHFADGDKSNKTIGNELWSEF